ncbi:probable glutamate receptor isoform X2 [Symsagittifera roscoffensis]|uniref:probable glutamate receptor isoform X2 n=1 Tax=Symsagittifera roscoffensis TaxID=84072 RepID=UPI00307C9C76
MDPKLIGMAVPLLFLILVSYPELVLSETLTVTTIESEPFLRKHDDGKLSGYCYDLAQKLSEQMNMDLSMKLVADSQYGQQTDENTWTGMVGEVMTGKAQVAIAPLTVTTERSKFVSFTKPFMSSYLGFVAKKPVYEVTNTDVVLNMLQVFSLAVWILIFISFFLIGGGLWLVAKLIGDEELSRVENAVHYIVATLLFLTPSVQPKHVVTRVYTYLWLLFRVTVFILYVVFLYKWMSVDRVTREPAMRNFDDLAMAAKEGRVKVLMPRYGATEKTFSSSQQEIFEIIYDNFLINAPEQPSIEMVHADKRNVYIGEMPMLKYEANKPPCDLYVTGGDHKNSLQPLRGYAIAVNKEDVDLFNKVSDAMNFLEDMGVFLHLERKYFDQQFCSSNEIPGISGRQMMSLVPARSIFLLVLIIILYAIAVFVYTKAFGTSQRSGGETKQTEMDPKGGDIEKNSKTSNEHEA